MDSSPPAQRPEVVPPADEVVAAFVSAVNEAGDDPLLSQRLGVARVVVAFELRELPGRRVVLSLTPAGVWAQDGSAERAEVEVVLSALDLHELFAGGLPLPMKIAAHTVTYRGPVRRFLRIIAPLGELRSSYGAALGGAFAYQEGDQL